MAESPTTPRYSKEDPDDWGWVPSTREEDDVDEDGNIIDVYRRPYTGVLASPPVSGTRMVGSKCLYLSKRLSNIQATEFIGC